MNIGEKIQEKRKKRGFTQEWVEEHLNLPQKSMSRIEGNIRQPTTLELAKLADLFNIQISEFFEDNHSDNVLIALHRKDPILKDKDVQQEIDRCVHICQEGIALEKLLELPSRENVFISSVSFPKNQFDAIRQGIHGAKEERKRLGIPTHPIKDLDYMLNAEGIWCTSTRLPNDLSGLFLCDATIGRVIIVNSSEPKARKRFSIAHEYAHAIFDTEHHVHISQKSNSSHLIEVRANAFAAAFLMPEEGVSELLYNLNKGSPSRKSFSIIHPLCEKITDVEERKIARFQKISAQDIAFIANHYEVSYQAAVYRLHNLGYFNSDEREELLNQESNGKLYLKILKYKDSEQIENDSFPQRELLTYVTRLVIEAFRQEKISRGRLIELCKLMNLPPLEVLELAESNE